MPRNIDDLWEHLDARLDKQDEERQAMAKEVAGTRTDVEVLKKAAEGDKAACQAQHTSARRRVARLEGGFIAVGIAGLAACGALIWEAAKKAASR